MITAAEALKLTEETLPEEKRAALLKDTENRIRAVAAQGQSSLRLEHLTDAQQSFLRAVLTQHGFQLSEIGLTIYW